MEHTDSRVMALVGDTWRAGRVVESHRHPRLPDETLLVVEVTGERILIPGSKTRPFESTPRTTRRLDLGVVQHALSAATAEQSPARKEPD